MTNLMNERLLVLCLLLMFLCTACGSGGSPAASAPPDLSIVGQTRNMTFMGGQPYTCWLSQDSTQLWCWTGDASDPNAQALGLTTTPALYYQAPTGYQIIQLKPKNEAICYVENLHGNVVCAAGDPASPDVNTIQTMPCTVTAPDAFSECYDGRGYSPTVYTFQGVTLSSLSDRLMTAKYHWAWRNV